MAVVQLNSLNSVEAYRVFAKV